MYNTNIKTSSIQGKINYHINSNGSSTFIKVLRNFIKSGIELYWLKVPIHFRFEQSMVLPKKRSHRHQTTSPSQATQEYIPLVNIGLTRQCKYAGFDNAILMDLNDRVILGYYAKHTICIKRFIEEVVSTDCGNKLIYPCYKEKKKEFTYHQQSFFTTRRGRRRFVEENCN